MSSDVNDIFDVDSFHVILEPYLAVQSRDNWQNNYYKSQKRVLSPKVR